MAYISKDHFVNNNVINLFSFFSIFEVFSILSFKLPTNSKLFATALNHFILDKLLVLILHDTILINAWKKKIIREVYKITRAHERVSVKSYLLVVQCLYNPLDTVRFAGCWHVSLISYFASALTRYTRTRQ